MSISTVPPNNGLFGGTVPPNNGLFGGTVPPNNGLFEGTVPPNNRLFGDTVPPNDFFEKREVWFCRACKEEKNEQETLDSVDDVSSK